jgi:two-component system CheB/CheR fusion protein
VPVYGGPLPQAAPPPATSVLQGLRVLVVDDSVDSADTQALLLRLAGAQVVAATSGAEALACLDRERFELLVSDISMPGMSGLDLIAAVRARPEGPQLMALACSGYGRPQDVRRAEEAGYDTLLPKPASLAQIEQAVAALRARRAG